jgi:aspartate kinase
MTLRNMGHDARSFLGWQVPIITDRAHGSARIEDIPPANLEACFAAARSP